MIKRRLALLIAAVILFVYLLGCSSVPTDSIMNNATKYSSLYTYQGMLYRIKDKKVMRFNYDLTDETTLADPGGYILNIADDFIWYTYNNSLYSVRVDGTDCKQLGSEIFNCQYATDRWVYGENYDGKLQRISKMDGRVETVSETQAYIIATSEDSVCFSKSNSLFIFSDNMTKPKFIMESKLTCITITGDDIYISSLGVYTYNLLTGKYDYAEGTNDQGCLFRYDIKTGLLQKIMDVYTRSIHAYKEGLFYHDDKRQLFWIPTGSKKPVLLTDNPVTGLNGNNNWGETFHLQDGWFYCTTGRDDFRLLRIHLKSKKIETLSEETMGAVWFYGDKIYYRCMDFGQADNSNDVFFAFKRPQVFRMNLDGTGVEKVAEFEKENLGDIWVIPPYIYANRTLYAEDVYAKMSLNGTNRQTVDVQSMPVQGLPRSEEVTGGQLFYVKKTYDEDVGYIITGTQIRCANPNGSNDRVFYDKTGSNFVFKDKWLYFYNMRVIYRVLEGGTEQVVASQASYEPFTLCGDYVIYSESSSSTLHSARIDGTSNIKLTDKNVLLVGVWNGRIYYKVDQEIHSILPDGSDDKTIYTLEEGYSFSDFAVCDNWIYTCLYDKRINGTLVRLNCNSGQIEELAKTSGASFSTSDKNVFFIGEDSKLWRLDTQSLSLTSLTKENISYFRVMGDEVFFAGRMQDTEEFTAVKLGN